MQPELDKPTVLWPLPKTEYTPGAGPARGALGERYAPGDPVHSRGAEAIKLLIVADPCSRPHVRRGAAPVLIQSDVHVIKIGSGCKASRVIVPSRMHVVRR